MMTVRPSLAAIALIASACGAPEIGGVTARLVFGDGLGAGRGALRAAAPPAEVDKLII